MEKLFIHNIDNTSVSTAVVIVLYFQPASLHFQRQILIALDSTYDYLNIFLLLEHAGFCFRLVDRVLVWNVLSFHEIDSTVDLFFV